MKTFTSEKPETGLWGIYHADRDYAGAIGDPLRTVLEAPTRITAEEIAAALGFGEPLAQPMGPESAHRAQWLPQGNRKSVGRNVTRIAV